MSYPSLWASEYKYSLIIQMNLTHRAVLSCGAVYYAVLCVLTFESVDEILKCDHSNESYWAVCFCAAVLPFESVDEIIKCGHSDESYWEVLSCGTVYYAVQGGSNFWVCGWNHCVAIQMQATEQYFPVVLFIMLYKVVLTFESVDETLKRDHSNESYWVPSCGALCYVAVVTFGFCFQLWPFWKKRSKFFWKR